MAKEKDSKSAESKPERFEGGGGMNTGVALIGFVLCFLAGAGLMWGYDTNRMKQGGGAITADSTGGAAWSDDESPVPVSSKDPVWGSRTAPVTIVVFSDFQCPFCKRIESTFEELRKTYGTSIRFVWKNNPLPFHKNAVPAANFAMEARSQKGDQTFWAAHDLLFGEQQNLSEQTLEGFAKQLGLDVQKTMAAVRTEKWKSVIDADKALADKLEARGTPATFVNGRFLTGAQPLERFKTIIDEELQKAKSGGLGVQGGAVQPKVNLAP